MTRRKNEQLRMEQCIYRNPAARYNSDLTQIKRPGFSNCGHTSRAASSTRSTPTKIICQLTMRFTLLTACLFGFVVFVCPKSIDRTGQVRLNNNPPQISIINGIPAQAGEFPFMASLLLPFSTGYRLCGGTLFEPSYILTAAHCVDGLLPGTGFVFINTLNMTSGDSVIRRASSYVIHQQYFVNTTNILNDIALVVLDQPVPATANITFVKLPTALTTTTTLKPTTTTPKPTTTTPKSTTKTTTKPTTKTTTKTTTTKKPSTTVKSTTKTSKPSTKPVVTSTIKTIKTTTKKRAAHLRAFSTYSNESAIITGWGVTSSGNTSWTLQKANVTVYDNSVCNQQWGRQFNGSTQVCAAKLNTAICFGDSGGPLLVNGNVQIGISSFVSGRGCDDPTHAPVFTRVSAYLDWIAATMASNPPPAPGK